MSLLFDPPILKLNEVASPAHDLFVEHDLFVTGGHARSVRLSSLKGESLRVESGNPIRSDPGPAGARR